MTARPVDEQVPSTQKRHPLSGSCYVEADRHARPCALKVGGRRCLALAERRRQPYGLIDELPTGLLLLHSARTGIQAAKNRGASGSAGSSPLRSIALSARDARYAGLLPTLVLPLPACRSTTSKASVR